MTNNQNNKITRVIWLSLAWVFFSFNFLEIYFISNSCNFDINILGLLIVGYSLYSEKVVDGYYLIANIILNICLFYIPLGNTIAAFLTTTFFNLLFTIYKFYVLYSAFIYVKRFCVKATRIEVEKKFETQEQSQDQAEVQSVN